MAALVISLPRSDLPKVDIVQPELHTYVGLRRGDGIADGVCGLSLKLRNPGCESHDLLNNGPESREGLTESEYLLRTAYIPTYLHMPPIAICTHCFA